MLAQLKSFYKSSAFGEASSEAPAPKRIETKLFEFKDLEKRLDGMSEKQKTNEILASLGLIKQEVTPTERAVNAISGSEMCEVYQVILAIDAFGVNCKMRGRQESGRWHKNADAGRLSLVRYQEHFEAPDYWAAVDGRILLSDHPMYGLAGTRLDLEEKCLERWVSIDSSLKDLQCLAGVEEISDELILKRKKIMPL